MNKSSKILALTALAVSAIVVCVVIALAVVLSGRSTDDVEKININSFHPSAYRKFSSYAVSSDSEVCSKIGKSIFQRNGSAVDVSIATMICIGVVSLHSCGFGGGHLAIIYDTPRNESRKILTTITARERAPRKAKFDMFRNISSEIGGLAVAVPGEIKGFYNAWKRFGRLPWSDLLDPSIKLLENGFVVEKSLAKAISMLTKDQLDNNPSLKATFTKNDGTLLKLGDIIKDQKLAVTYRNISADPMSFYEGHLAVEVAKEVQNAGGIITEEDLKNYEVEWKEATAIKLQGTNLTHHSLRPPSSGVVLGLILNILAGYKLTPNDFSPKNMGLTYHRLVEAFKFSYAGRGMMGDENFVNVSQLMQKMISKEFAEFIRAKIDDRKTFNNTTHYNNSYNQFEDHGTSHVSVYGPDGSAVAMTSTINTGFGSLVKGSKTGILYNNEMDDFSSPFQQNYYGYVPSPTNYIQSGKIPMSSTSPSFLMDSQGNVKYVFGAEGGSRIITALAGVAVGALWGNETLNQSVDRARVHHQLLPDRILYEDWISQMHIDGLKSKGHMSEVISPEGWTAVCNIIKINCYREDCIESVADGRKGGEPDGM
ncbi:hypothetical protein HELRODRAFT_162424 [Helobdella robusta]|uniref:Gamma-glutamyltransferase n=1 Tax=Helobdella robusta TaxID=6412 RepID=T1ESM8_HELRO|nr:hypothetical protein HELRODRAFT_162424 [Helobdella robusta]ESN98952.1 hypothetical protein HELRODRAFT_162424 [Helobdella robusta]